MTTLTDFAATNGPKKKTRCFTCQLPQSLREQVEDGFINKNVTLKIISEWLASENHKIAPPTLHNHFQRGHHLEDEAIR